MRVLLEIQYQKILLGEVNTADVGFLLHALHGARLVRSEGSGAGDHYVEEARPEIRIELLDGVSIELPENTTDEITALRERVEAAESQALNDRVEMRKVAATNESLLINLGNARADVAELLKVCAHAEITTMPELKDKRAEPADAEG